MIKNTSKYIPVLKTNTIDVNNICRGQDEHRLISLFEKRYISECEYCHVLIRHTMQSLHVYNC